jgi:Tfp pilus assembly protein PilF
MRAPAKGTDNLYPMPVFLHPGVSCERCHGPGAAHVAGAPGAIVNPARLSPERRDAVCMQCHLEGKVAIERPGRHAYEFQAGESLSDYTRYYILTGGQAGGLGGASQVEALAQSVCKRKSGDVMSCTSCHDPHYEPPAEERTSYYRGKCVACHGTQFAAKHHTDQSDCTLCHMPAASSTDVAHTQVTDHRIPRRPEGPPQPGKNADLAPVTVRLVPFPDSTDAEQDLRSVALAWNSLANNGMAAAGPHAEELLRSAVAKFPGDPALLTALAYLVQKHGSTVQASDLYRRALAVDPDLIDAAANLAVIDAQSGQIRDAVDLWQKTFQRAPGRSSLGMNLVTTFCDEKRFDEARATVLRVLEFNPDLAAAKKVLQTLNRTPPGCSECVCPW